MSEFKNGKFYYIQSDDIVDECFIDCLADLMTIIGKDVKIKVDLKSSANFKNTEGNSWSGNDAHSRTISMTNLFSDKSSEFIAFINI